MANGKFQRCMNRHHFCICMFSMSSIRATLLRYMTNPATLVLAVVEWRAGGNVVVTSTNSPS
ncbi:hypothetical protein KIN20_017220 [Parelaphostrongylus tenuis]|uniref:Uncharacterized protein n=1 Tax=Parelaphostrongylus tenuis TaxID=148309 RepID=A0AAD5QQJ3_PARTN|nr:hypothetical protein KIN20_017220 [Parelaphostrongylus tenuis]